MVSAKKPVNVEGIDKIENLSCFKQLLSTFAKITE